MSTNVITLDGVSLASSDIRARDCAWPITDMIYCVLGDEVFANMPIYIGEWADGTLAPGIVEQNHEIVMPEGLTVCESATVKTNLVACEFELPNQVEVSLCSEDLVIRDLVEKFCAKGGRNILPESNKKMFNADGSIRMGEPYVPNFMRIALNALENAPGELVLLSALRGDESNDFQFDGLYQQIDNGWTATQCPPLVTDPINLGQTIDWNVLTGGTGLASPDDETIAGQTVTLWGTVYDVPEGLNLAQFLEDLWIEAVELNFTARHGGVDNWEMHVPWGRARCFLNTAACMRPCGAGGVDCTGDDLLWERLKEYRSRNVATLWPSGTTFPLLQSQHLEDNTVRFGPKSIGGYPTYGLFFRDYNGILDAIAPMGLYGQSTGVTWDRDPIIMRRNDILRDNVEAAALYVDLDKVSSRCVRACIAYEAGVLALCRNLWLKVENITCASFVCAPTTGVTVEIQPNPPVPLEDL